MKLRVNKPESPEPQDSFLSLLTQIFRIPFRFKGQTIKLLRQERLKEEPRKQKFMPIFIQRVFNISFKKLRKYNKGK